MIIRSLNKLDLTDGYDPVTLVVDEAVNEDILWGDEKCNLFSWKDKQDVFTTLSLS